MTPEVLDDISIRIAGYDFDITGTIYPESNPCDVLKGRKLHEEFVSIDLYLGAFINDIFKLQPRDHR
jgi:hypothetical protein